MKNTVLITGGYGYIGSHIVIALQERGFDCVVLDSLINSDRSKGQRIEEVSGKKNIGSTMLISKIDRHCWMCLLKRILRMP